MRAHVLLALAVTLVVLSSPTSAQTIETYTTCNGGGLATLARLGLRCTSGFTLYKPSADTNRVDLRLSAVTFDSTSALRPSSPTAHIPLGRLLPTDAPDAPQLTFAVQAPKLSSTLVPAPFEHEDLVGRVRVSVSPVKADPRLLLFNPYLLRPQDPTSPRDSVAGLTPDQTRSVAPSVRYFRFDQNRAYVRFIEAGRKWSLVAVPVRVRLRPRPSDSPATQATGNFAAGVLHSWTWSEREFRFEQGTPAVNARTGQVRGLSVGVAASVAEVSAANGTGDGDRFADGETFSIPVLSPMMGLGFGNGDVLVNVFAGIDLGLFQGSESWDYQRAPWVGLGISSNALFPF